MRVPVSAQTKRLRGEVKDMKRTDADDDEVRFHRDAGAAGAVPGEVHACSCMHLCVRVCTVQVDRLHKDFQHCTNLHSQRQPDKPIESLNDSDSFTHTTYFAYRSNTPT